ncbi:TetR/AcrR family transcriptional regulator [Streptomyces sp. NPDC102467]|uniref:TetR/AcrR family transcriptional regulator n=1 Tax=Streptomyces sp. NPDC102467 TaxID=3366179 RepID=UPI0037FB7477
MAGKRTGGQPDKRRAIIEGALTLFARDGYTRAGLDAIAARAGVSNRTIYNHFADKAELFHTVIQESSQRVADAMTDAIERNLGKIVDLEEDLVGLGLAWLDILTSDLAVHFALVRQINAEADHIPAKTLAAWREMGPGRVRRELADRLRRLADRDLLDLDDPARAAGHLMMLISAENLTDPATLRDRKECTAMVTAGVRVFLHGYQR